jgi:hypothetical protein
VNDNHLGGLQTDDLDVFNTLIPDTPSATWHSEQRSSMNMESLRDISGMVGKTINMQPVPGSHARRTLHGSRRDMSSGRANLRLPSASPVPSSCPSTSPPSIVDSRARAPPEGCEVSLYPTIEPEVRCRCRCPPAPEHSGRQQASPPIDADADADGEELERAERRSLPVRNGTSRFHPVHPQPHSQPPPPRGRSSCAYPGRAARGENEGQTCLHLAAAEGSSTLVRYFLGRGMWPNARDSHGLTALHYAIRGGHEDTVSELLLGGADIEVTDYRGRTALHFAIEKRQERIVFQLIGGGANMHATVAGCKSTQ